MKLTSITVNTDDRSFFVPVEKYILQGDYTDQEMQDLAEMIAFRTKMMMMSVLANIERNPPPPPPPIDRTLTLDRDYDE